LRFSIVFGDPYTASLYYGCEVVVVGGWLAIHGGMIVILGSHLRHARFFLILDGFVKKGKLERKPLSTDYIIE